MSSDLDLNSDFPDEAVVQPCFSSSCCAMSCLLSVCFVQVAARALSIATNIRRHLDATISSHIKVLKAP